MKIPVEVTQEDIDRGVLWNGEYCPIALAAARQTKYLVYVSGRSVSLYDPETGRIAWVGLPREAKEFVRAFDAGDPVKPLSFRLRWPYLFMRGFTRLG